MSAPPQAVEIAKQASSDAGKTAEGVVKVSMNLPARTVDDLRSVAERRGTTLTEVVRDAIGLMKFLDDATRDGKKDLLLRSADGALERLVLRW